MSLTYVSALDEMFGLLLDAWDNGVEVDGVLTKPADIVGYKPALYWPGDNEPNPPDASKFWARASVQPVGEGQSALSNPSRRYTAFGLLFVQIFGVKADPAQTDKARRLAEIARNAYRGKATNGGVWFRNCRIQELSPENGMARINVVIEWEYDETTN